MHGSDAFNIWLSLEFLMHISPFHAFLITLLFTSHQEVSFLVLLKKQDDV